MIKIIIINNQLIVLDKLLSESDEMFYDRVDFILENYNRDDLEILISYSKIYSNIKYKKCVYSKEIMNQIQNLSSRI